jgi:iron complex transport system permease protein
VLTGFVLSALFMSAGALLETFAQQSWELSRALALFSRGSVSGAGSRQVQLALFLVVGGTLPVLARARSLDLLLSGEEEALSLGVDVASARFWAVVWVAVITAGAVAVGGSEAFIGLIVPHALRPFVGEAHRRLLPASFVTGGIVLVLADVLCRALPLRSEVPLSVITSLVGAPLFLWMLARLVREGRDG